MRIYMRACVSCLPLLSTSSFETGFLTEPGLTNEPDLKALLLVCLLVLEIQLRLCTQTLDLLSHTYPQPWGS